MSQQNVKVPLLPRKPDIHQFDAWKEDFLLFLASVNPKHLLILNDPVSPVSTQEIRAIQKATTSGKSSQKATASGKAPPQLAAGDSEDDDDTDDSKSGGLQPAHSSTSRSATLMPLVSTWIDILLPPATRLQANIQIRAFLTEAIPHGHPAALTIARAGNDPADKWAALSDRYGNKGQIATAKLLLDLFQGTITSSDDLPTFIDRTHVRFEQLAARNIILPDMMKTIFTLHRLHASHHDYLKTVGTTLYWSKSDHEKPTFDEFSRLILQQHHAHGFGPSNEYQNSVIANYASEQKNGGNRSRGGANRGTANGGATKKCHNCSRTNHVAGDCRATCTHKGCEGKPTHSGAECPLPRRSQKSTKSTTRATPPPKSEKDESDEEQATPSTASFPDAPLQPTVDSGGGMFSFNLDDNKNRQRITSDEIEAAQTEEPHSPPSTGPEAQTRVDISTERTLDQRFASLLDARETTADIAHDPRARRAYGSLTATRIVAGPHLRYPPNQPSNPPNPADPPNPAGPPNPTNPEEYVWQTPDVREFMQLLEDKRRGEETTQRNIEGERNVPIMINPPTNDIPYLRNLYLRCAANVWNRFPHPWLKADGRAPAMYDMHGTDPAPMHPNLHHPDKRPNIPWESSSRSQQIDENDYQRALSHWHNLQSVNSDNLTICGFPPPPVHWPPPWRPKETSYAYPMPRPTPWFISTRMAAGRPEHHIIQHHPSLPLRRKKRLRRDDGRTTPSHSSSATTSPPRISLVRRGRRRGEAASSSTTSPTRTRTTVSTATTSTTTLPTSTSSSWDYATANDVYDAAVARIRTSTTQSCDDSTPLVAPQRYSMPTPAIDDGSIAGNEDMSYQVKNVFRRSGDRNSPPQPETAATPTPRASQPVTKGKTEATPPTPTLETAAKSYSIIDVRECFRCPTIEEVDLLQRTYTFTIGEKTRKRASRRAASSAYLSARRRKDE
eukprot:g58212.t1